MMWARQMMWEFVTIKYKDVFVLDTLKWINAQKTKVEIFECVIQCDTRA